MSEQPDNLSERIRSALAHEVRSTPAVPPSPLDARIASHRRSTASNKSRSAPWQQRRFAIGGVAVLMAAAAVAGVVVVGNRDPGQVDVSGPAPVAFTPTSDVAPEPGMTTSVAPPLTTNASPKPSDSVGTPVSPVPRPAPIAAAPEGTETEPAWSLLPAGVRVAIAAADGIYQIDRGTQTKITDEIAADLVADESTLELYAQLASERLESAAGRAELGPIYHVSRDGRWTSLVAVPDGVAGLRMHDAMVVDDTPYLVYEIVEGAANIASARNTLHLLNLSTNESKEVAELGGWEEGTSRLRWSQALRRLVGERFSGPCWEPIVIALDGSEPVLGPYSACDDSSRPTGFTVLDDGRMAWTRTEVDPESGFATFAFLEVGELGAEPVAELSWAYPTDGAWTPAYGALEAGHTMGVINRSRYFWELDASLQRATMIDLRTGGVFQLPLAGRAAIVGEPAPLPDSGWVFPAATAFGAVLPEQVGTPTDIAERMVAFLQTTEDQCDGLAVHATLVSESLIEIEVRESCDDSVAGALHRFALIPQGDRFIIDSVSEITLCWRGVTRMQGLDSLLCV